VEKMGADKRTFENVFVQTRRNGVLNVIAAARGHQEIDSRTGARYLVLEDGYRYEGQPGDSQFKIIRFIKHGVLLEEQQVKPSIRSEVAASTPSLWGKPGRNEKVELQWRVAMPLAAILLAALAVPLSRSGPRQGRFAKLFIAVVIYALYMNFLAVARSWVEHGVISPALGLWWVHGTLLLVIVALTVKQAGMRWLVMRFSDKAVLS